MWLCYVDPTTAHAYSQQYIEICIEDPIRFKNYKAVDR